MAIYDLRLTFNYSRFSGFYSKWIIFVLIAYYRDLLRVILGYYFSGKNRKLFLKLIDIFNNDVRDYTH
jgi:hypothetical protein